MYKKLAGMTGTAETEAAEFYKIYKLEVIAIPDKPAADPQGISGHRLSHRRREFRNAAKYIKELNEKGQPVLVGTISVEKSEKLSRILGKMGVEHEVLNAKQPRSRGFDRGAGGP